MLENFGRTFETLDQVHLLVQKYVAPDHNANRRKEKQQHLTFEYYLQRNKLTTFFQMGLYYLNLKQLMT